MSSRRAQLSEHTGPGRFVKQVLISVAVGAVVCIAALLLMSVILSARSIPQSAVNPMATFAVALGAFVAGFCCAKLIRQNGLLFGLITGAVYGLVVFLASFAVEDGGFGIPALLKLAFMLLAAMLGGVLGVNTRQRRKKR